MLFDRSSARRAEGLSIDYVQGPEGPAFKLENPNEPPRVKSIDVRSLKEKMAAGGAIELLDVRSQKERDVAKIEGSKLLGEVIAALPVEERTDPGLLREAVRVELRRFYKRRVGRRPLVLPVVMEI